MAHEVALEEKDECASVSSTHGDAHINYAKAESYWSSVTPSVDGMLGGFSSLSSLDVRHSKTTLARLRDEFGMRTDYALDCGSGIGRVAKALLLPFFTRVDLVDVTPSFIAESSAYLGDDDARVGTKTIARLQDVHLEAGKYDCVWVQWVAGHLTDDDFRAFFRRCAESVRERGVVVLKENTTKSAEADVDQDDSSYTRNRRHILRLFADANLSVLLDVDQEDWPKGMYRVRTFVVRNMLAT